MKLSILGLLSCLLLTQVAPVHAAEPPSANEIFRSAGKIVTPDGINEQRLVTIGGIQQWISIRGRHSRGRASCCGRR